MVRPRACDGACADRAVARPRAFRGANGKIALVTQGKTRDEIAVVKPDGTGFKTLAKSKKRSFLNPRWSPDGKRIAMTSGLRGQTPQGWVMRRNGKGRKFLVFGETPSWSPGGNKLVYRGVQGLFAGLFVIKANGKGKPKRLTQESLFHRDIEPRWSPNGKKILFTRAGNSEANFQIWRINSNGKRPRKLVEGADPDWSPNGRRIVFNRLIEASGSDPQTLELYVMNAKGKGITQGIGLAEDPVWSPDGTKIVFSLGDDPSNDVYTINADGTGLTQLTTDMNDNRTPDWQPVR